MAPVDVLAWLSKKQDVILTRWKETVVRQDIPTFCELDDQDLQQQLLPLYGVVVQAVEQQSQIDADRLVSWIQDHQRDQDASLTGLLRVAFALRTALGEALMESSDAWHAMGTWQTLFPYIDQATALLSEIYTNAVQETLTERLREAQYLASSLSKATQSAGKRLLQLRSVFDVSQVLGSSLDMDEILSELVRKLGEALGARHCAVWLSDIGTMNMAAAYSSMSAEAPTITLTEPPASFEKVLYSGESNSLIIGEDLEPQDVQLMQQLQVKMLLIAPLTIQTIPIGVMTLGCVDETDFLDETEIELVESILRQAGVSVQNAGLYDEIRAINDSLEVRIAARTKELGREKDRMSTLYAISAELSASLDLNQVLDKTLRLITQAVDAKHGSIMLYDRNQDTLIYRARLGGERELPPEGQVTSFKPGVGIAGWVLENKAPVLIPDVLQDDRWLPRGTQTRSLIAVPLMTGEDVLGIIFVYDAEPNVFDDSNLRLVIASAHQVAQTIHNAQLYRDVNESASRNQAILESIADGVIVNNPHNKVIVFNAAAEKILGMPQPVALRSQVQGLFDSFDSAGRSSALAALDLATESIENQSEQSVEITLESEGQVVSGHIAPVIAADSQFLGIVTALRDITREVEADRAKSEFVSTVSHELRTPLTSIKGYADLLHAAAVGPINDAQKRFLGIIKTNSDRLTLLINDLLDISRIDAGRIRLNMQNVDLVEILQEVVDSLQAQVESKGLCLEVNLPIHPLTVHGDRARLVQVATNLLSNAYKYTDEGWVRIDLNLLEETVRLDVVDSGIGISAEDQAKIFERFYRADTPVVEGRGGTGLGLAITKDLVELHGGRIWFQSELNVGSTFTVVLPTTTRPLPASLLDNLPADAHKVLVVDDDRDIVSLLRYQLQAKGYQVVVATNGEQAIAKALDEKPDLITLDILLPDRNGFDILQELKERTETSHIPVIVLSVVQDEDSGYKLGAADYITKPVDEHRLIQSVSRVLGRRGRILIAEDDIATAEMLVALFERHEFQVSHAVDGYQVLSMARREHPGLILMDLKMPGMDGYEALSRLKKDVELRKIPILAMSAHTVDTVQERLKLQEMGAYDLMSKPFDLDELIAEILHMQSQVEENDKSRKNSENVDED